MKNQSHPTLTDLSPQRLAAAVEESHIAWMPLFGLLGEYRVDCPPGVKRSITTIKHPLVNSITGAQLEEAQLDQVIAGIEADASARGIPLTWWIGPLTRPAGLGATLAARGWQGEDSPGMAVDLAKLNETLPVPPGFTIQRAGDEAGRQLWARTNRWAWTGTLLEDPNSSAMYRIICAADPGLLLNYTGLLNGEAVAVSQLFLGAGVAGIYSVATHPSARRMGIGAQMTLQPLLDARQMGYRAGVLAASEMGASVYRSVGFEEVCRIKDYVWPVR